MEKGINLCKNIIPDIDKHTVTNIFTETYSKDSVCIEENKLEEGYIWRCLGQYTEEGGRKYGGFRE